MPCMRYVQVPVRAAVTLQGDVYQGGTALFAGQTYIDSDSDGSLDSGEQAYPNAQVGSAASGSRGTMGRRRCN
jgi:hypothetical protein